MHVWHRIEHLLNHALVVQVKDFVKLPLGAAVPNEWGQSGNCDKMYIGIERCLMSSNE